MNLLEGQSEVRRSPRIAAMMLQLFVHKATEKNHQIKVSGSADILRDIPIQSTIQQLASKLREYDGDVIYVHTNGLYWLRKGTKHCASLKTDQDFRSAITEYTNNGQISPINIACCTVNIPSKSGNTTSEFLTLNYI